MSARRGQSRRRKKRSSNAPMPMGGAGLMRFFEDASIGIKIGPLSSVLIATGVIVIVILAHIGLFDWIFA
ncbi:MAG: preprotein translocase subunit Sec61beta [Promethearchaeota archaeon]